MTTPVTEALTVTQADELAAAKFMDDHGWLCEESWNDLHEQDQEVIAKAFARHRLAHTTPTEPVLRWDGDGYRLMMGDCRVGTVWLQDGHWQWQCLMYGVSTAPTAAEAKTAAEQAVRDWLARAGLVRQGGEPHNCARCAEEWSAYMDEAVSKAPEPLRALGEYLTSLLDDDQWKSAERYLNAAVLAHPPASPTAEVVEALNAVNRELSTKGRVEVGTHVACLVSEALAKVRP